MPLLQVERRSERTGLGTQSSSNSPFAVGPDGRISKWERMRLRFVEAQASAPGFREAGRRAGGGGVGWLKGKAEGGEE